MSSQVEGPCVLRDPASSRAEPLSPGGARDLPCNRSLGDSG